MNHLFDLNNCRLLFDFIILALCSLQYERKFFCSAFQLVIGVALIFLGRYNVSHAEHVQKAERLNNWVVLGVFLITSINVFISAFGIEPVERIDPVLIVDAALDSLKKQSDVEPSP